MAAFAFPVSAMAMTQVTRLAIKSAMSRLHSPLHNPLRVPAAPLRLSFTTLRHRIFSGLPSLAQRLFPCRMSGIPDLAGILGNFRITLLRRFLFLTALALILPARVATAQPLEVVYPGASAGDQRVDYYLKLLQLALDKTGVAYNLRPNDAPMSPPRVVRAIENDEGLNVVWSPDTQEMERRLQAVRIPIDKGILGWRLLLIKKSDHARFAGVHTLAQLKAYAAGQQADWADADILRANDIPLVGAASYHNMFDMLAADRFQYFPRGVGEIWGEEKSHATLDLEIEPHLALHYPANTYYFVGKNNHKLAALIEQGLRALIKDGGFDKLFDQYNGEALRQAHLGTRVVFRLNNPLLPAKAPDWDDDNPIIH